MIAPLASIGTLASSGHRLPPSANYSIGTRGILPEDIGRARIDRQLESGLPVCIHTDVNWYPLVLANAQFESSYS
jgi:hypothetical protein